jgi:hypothetical protein
MYLGHTPRPVSNDPHRGYHNDYIPEETSSSLGEFFKHISIWLKSLFAPSSAEN